MESVYVDPVSMLTYVMKMRRECKGDNSILCCKKSKSRSEYTFQLLTHLSTRYSYNTELNLK